MYEAMETKEKESDTRCRSHVTIYYVVSCNFFVCYIRRRTRMHKTFMMTSGDAELCVCYDC